MHIRRLLLSASLTFCAAAVAWWILSVYVSISPVQNAPSVTTQFNGEQAVRYLYTLTHQYKNRIMGSAQGFAAADYVAEQFRSIGLKVQIQDFRELGTKGVATKMGWFRERNVIGVLPGRGLGTVVLTAHRDCNPNSDEGAYDSGSGTVAVLELARVLVASSPHQYT
jgi:acetylornithine deacetylase/succinyl-diaminopimelate desuccinylase-like protein